MKQPLASKSATILLKTPSMKFYDKGFISHFEEKIHLTIFSFGNIVLDIDIYKDKICESPLRCMDAKEFNTKYFSNSYKDDFLYQLFLQDTISFKDTKNGILIKVIDK